MSVQDESEIPVVILCGGKGLRLSGHGQELPKALVEVGGKPILWHVMKLYADHGFRKFVLCLGHLGPRIKEFFLQGRHWQLGDITLVTGERKDQVVADGAEREWSLTFAETGENTSTGGRIKRIERYIDGDVFCATYVDGLADVDLSGLLAFHRAHGRIATVTSVNPVSPFGMLDVDGEGRVGRFVEKPRLGLWINGGFFVFRREVFAHLRDGSDLERDTLAGLAELGELRAHQHRGFWACMDTYKDTLTLSQLCESGGAPWLAEPPLLRRAS
jgi:glucose-1-phosphate cytidylyltransferase